MPRRARLSVPGIAWHISLIRPGRRPTAITLWAMRGFRKRSKRRLVGGQKAVIQVGWDGLLPEATGKRGLSPIYSCDRCPLSEIIDFGVWS